MDIRKVRGQDCYAARHRGLDISITPAKVMDGHLEHAWQVQFVGSYREPRLGFFDASGTINTESIQTAGQEILDMLDELIDSQVEEYENRFRALLDFKNEAADE